MSWSHSPLVAEFFDVTHPMGSSIGDLEFHLRGLGGVQGRVLEPACGTGRVLVALLEAGHDAEGLDHSPDMIDICRRHCRDRGFDPPLHVADMATFVAPERYAAIVMPRGAIRNVEGPDHARQALESFRASLAPGGVLQLDVRVPLIESAPGPMLHHQRDQYVWTVKTEIVDYDPILNRAIHFGRFEKWRDGDLVATELHRFYMQHWTLAEFSDLLASCGFEGITVGADFDEDAAPGPGSTFWNFRAVRS